MSDANTREPNLLIIRRGGSAELEAPKGGVWKIAYADFMTAMMAFFLVMWLINATSETTKTGVANYFNPIKLSDGRQLPRKGLHDPEAAEFAAAEPAKGEAVEHPEGEASDAAAENAEGHEAKADEAESSDAHAAKAEEAKPSGRIARYSEDALFRDPYAVLAAIAAEAEGTTSLSGRGTGGAAGAGAEDDRRQSEIYGDPFDPASWGAGTPPAPGPAEAQLLPATEAGEPATQAEPAKHEETATHEVSATHGASAQPAPETAPQNPGVEATVVKSTISSAGATGNPAASEDGIVTAGAGPDEHAGPGGAGGDANETPLRQKLAEALNTGSRSMPNVTVERADGGVLISLADQVEFGMFAIGSAEPLPETIAAMEKIAGLLKDLPGKVVIRGHTDGRPFRSGGYDNWRLSSARAHMAYHMLVRGGLDETRVERIEGYADRDLKLPDDPDAAENRRIDILVQEVQS
jgi:chemotaxis protein MotB